MPARYRVRTRYSQHDGSRPLTADGPFALWNGSADYVVKLYALGVEWNEGITVNPANGLPSSTVGGELRIVRISSLAGGEAVPATKHDTASANLPSQVLCRVEPTAATVGDVLRHIVDTPGTAPTTANYNIVANGPGRGKLDLSTLWSNEGSTVQVVTCREGEGVAILQDTSFRPFLKWMRLRVEEVGGGSYSFFTADPRCAGMGQPLLAFFNGSGSGKVYRVSVIVLTDIGRNDRQPSLRLVPFTREPLAGEPLTPLKFDSSEADVPAGIECLRNGYVQQFEIDPARLDYWAGVAGNPTFSDRAMYNLAVTLGNPRFYLHNATSWGQPISAMRNGRFDLLACAASRPHALRPQQGIALLYGGAVWPLEGTAVATELNLQPNTFHNFDVVADFDVEAIPAASGGGFIPIRRAATVMKM